MRFPLRIAWGPAAAALVLVAHPGIALGDDVLDGWARRGAVYRSVVMDGGTPAACRALCDGDGLCRSWVWTMPGLNGPDTQCALLSAAPTPYRAPGRITGLADVLVRQIEAAAERPPTPREVEALRAADRANHP